MTSKKTRTRRPYKREEPVSLAPLDLPTALGALMKAKVGNGDDESARLELTPDQVRILYRLGAGEEIRRPAASAPGNAVDYELEGLRREDLVTWPAYGESRAPVSVTLTDRGRAVVEAIHRQK